MTACQRCAAVGRDCCRVLPIDNPRHRLGLTIDDVLRMGARLGRSPCDFAAIEPIEPQLVKLIADGVPGSERMFVHQVRITLRLDDRGVCVLHDPKRGCPLSIMDRPRFCALYPAWYDPADLGLYPFALIIPTRCLAVDECGMAPEVLFQALGIDPHVLVDIAAASNAELCRHAESNLEHIQQTVEG